MRWRKRLRTSRGKKKRKKEKIRHHHAFYPLDAVARIGDSSGRDGKVKLLWSSRSQCCRPLFCFYFLILINRNGGGFMPSKKEEIKFEVVTHFSGSKPMKEVLKDLILHEASEIDASKNNMDKYLSKMAE